MGYLLSNFIGMISCVGGSLPHAVRSLVKYKVPTIERKVAFHDLQVPQATRDNNKILKNNVQETL